MLFLSLFVVIYVVIFIHRRDSKYLCNKSFFKFNRSVSSQKGFLLFGIGDR